MKDDYDLGIPWLAGEKGRGGSLSALLISRSQSSPLSYVPPISTRKGTRSG